MIYLSIQRKSNHYLSLMSCMNNKQILDEIQRKIKELQYAVIIDLQGNITEYLASKYFFNDMMSFDELKYVVKIVSLRFGIVDFDKILHGLEITINVFSECIMMATSLDRNILIVFVPRNANQTETSNTVLQIKKSRIQSVQTLFHEG